MGGTKTYTGCWTCRYRKVKCDLGHPACEQCKRIGVRCGGYSVRLRWGDDSGAKDYRRAIEFVKYPPSMLYSTHEELDRDLLHLDGSEVDHDVTTVRGPFAVFKGNLTEAPNAANNTHRRQQSVSEEIPAPLEELILEATSPADPVTETAIPNLSDELLELIRPEFAGTADEMLNLDDSLFQFLAVPSEPFGYENSALPKNSLAPVGALVLPDDLLIKDVNLDPLDQRAPPGLRPPTHGYRLTSLARYMFQHYEDEIVPTMSIVLSSKNIWRNMFSPRIQSAIGDICNRGFTTSSRFAIMYGTAAASAYHLRHSFRNSEVSTPPECTWFEQIGDQLYDMCRHWLFQCFKGQSIGKYKDFLVAILATSNVEYIKGDSTGREIRVAVLQRLISRRLHHRPKVSRKAHLLHMTCAVAVLLTKAATCWPDDAVNENESIEWLEVVFPDPSETDADRLRFLELQSLESRRVPLSYIENAEELDRYFHQYDVEIAESSEAFTTELMFAIPESLIRLLKECVKYSRAALWERTKLNGSEETFSSELSLRCTILEGKLHNWPHHYRAPPEIKDPNPDARTRRAIVVHHHTLAVYEALIVYHYRMAKDLSWYLLQPNVVRIIENWEAILHFNACSGRPLAIPALFSGFVGACEVAETDFALKRRYDLWFQAMEQYGLASYKQTARVVDEIHERRQRGESCDWWTLVQDHHVSFSLQ